MGYKEREVINKTLLEGTEKGRMFRVNCGMAWTGKMIYKTKNRITLENSRPFHGLPAGTPDLIGWECKEIARKSCASCAKVKECKTIDKLIKEKECIFIIDVLQNNICIFYKPANPEKIAIFKAIEIKTGNLKLTEKQNFFKEILLEHGGIYEERRD
jgi:hypothetical protein